MNNRSPFLLQRKSEDSLVKDRSGSLSDSAVRNDAKKVGPDARPQGRD